jgi:hypothetical protein
MKLPFKPENSEFNLFNEFFAVRENKKKFASLSFRSFPRVVIHSVVQLNTSIGLSSTQTSLSFETSRIPVP